MRPNLVKDRFSERSDPGEFEGERPLIHKISGAKRAAVTSNFESTFFGKGKSTDFRKVKSTP